MAIVERSNLLSFPIAFVGREALQCDRARECLRCDCLRCCVSQRYLAAVPSVSDAATVFPSVTLIGDVRLAARVSIWHGSVLRADINYIDIGWVLVL